MTCFIHIPRMRRHNASLRTHLERRVLALEQSSLFLKTRLVVLKLLHRKAVGGQVLLQPIVVLLHEVQQGTGCRPTGTLSTAVFGMQNATSAFKTQMGDLSLSSDDIFGTLSQFRSGLKHGKRSTPLEPSYANPTLESKPGKATRQTSKQGGNDSSVSGLKPASCCCNVVSCCTPQSSFGAWLARQRRRPANVFQT